MKYLKAEAGIDTLGFVHVVASARARCDYDGVLEGGEQRVLLRNRVIRSKFGRR